MKRLMLSLLLLAIPARADDYQAFAKMIAGTAHVMVAQNVKADWDTMLSKAAKSCKMVPSEQSGLDPFCHVSDIRGEKGGHQSDYFVLWGDPQAPSSVTLVSESWRDVGDHWAIDQWSIVLDAKGRLLEAGHRFLVERKAGGLIEDERYFGREGVKEKLKALLAQWATKL